MIHFSALSVSPVHFEGEREKEDISQMRDKKTLKKKFRHSLKKKNDKLLSLFLRSEVAVRMML